MSTVSYVLYMEIEYVPWEILLSYSINSFVQVPLLLSIGEEDTALMKATECGDTDLVYLVLFHIWQKVLALEN